MDPIATFQGLSTGIDFRDLVGQIIEAESRPAILMAKKRILLDQQATAWSDFRSKVTTLDAKASALGDGGVFERYLANVSGDGTSVSATATSSAVPGTYEVEVLQLATNEKVGSDSYADRFTAMGLSGEFLIGGRAVAISSQDSLDDVALAINLANSGANASGVSATLVGSSSAGYRIVMTAEDSGAAGIQLADGSSDLLRSLGFVEDATAIRHQTSDGAMSDGLKSATADIATLLGLSSPPAAGSVGIGALSVAVDLSTDSLDAIANAINTTAAGAGSSITASVVEEVSSDGATVSRLDISGTTSFTDSNRILETLGMVEAQRSAIAHQVQGSAFTDGDGVTEAAGTTLLTDLWSGGSSAGVQVGDTLTLGGTRGDGTTFTKTFTVGVSDTYQDLVDSLNDVSDGFGAGSRTVTVGIVGGALVGTDDVAGGSQLGLSIISNNEGGGTLDFGTFTTLTAGRSREITAGADAQVVVDGSWYSRSENVVNDIVPGVNLTLGATSASAVQVEVKQDTDQIVKEIEAFMKAFNAVSAYVVSQSSGAGGEDGGVKPPLAGENVLRDIRTRMRGVLESTLASSVSNFSRLSELGIEVNREGTYDIDTTRLTSAVESDPSGVRRVFSKYGTSESSTLRFLGAGDAAAAGAFQVAVTTVATRGSVTTSGFGGAYVDDGTPDVMTISDLESGSAYSVDLANGMTASQIVDALNAEFQTAARRQLQATNVVKSDAIGTDASEDTLLQDLFDAGGTNLGIANGDTLTISGDGPNDTSFYREWVVSDVSAQTLGDLRREVSNAIGTDVIVDVASGVLTATAVEPERASFTLAVSSDNAGGGSFSFGTISTTEEGRAPADIQASVVGGEIEITHDGYGSAEGFSVAYTAGGTDGTASLSLSAGDYAGVDVVGTIGGEAATGVGRILSGDVGTAAEGLDVQYSGLVTGVAGSVTFSRGIGALMEAVTDALLDGGEGSIQGIVERLDTQKEGIDSRIIAFGERMDLREANLIRKFTALEVAMAKAQQQGAWLQAQLGSLGSPSAEG